MDTTSPNHNVAELLEDVAVQAAATGDGILNKWHAAADAVHKLDEADARDALNYLLALHLFDRETPHPQVAMRNIKLCDVVQVTGGRGEVTEILRQGTGGFLRLNGKPELYAIQPNVTVPLLARPEQADQYGGSVMYAVTDWIVRFHESITGPTALIEVFRFGQRTSERHGEHDGQQFPSLKAAEDYVVEHGLMARA